jgi:hypothetical protein
LRHHCPDCAGRAVREDALPRLKVAVLSDTRLSMHAAGRRERVLLRCPP